MSLIAGKFGKNIKFFGDQEKPELLIATAILPSSLYLFLPSLPPIQRPP
jgi:hypothetical protein